MSLGVEKPFHECERVWMVETQVWCEKEPCGYNYISTKELAVDVLLKYETN